MIFLLVSANYDTHQLLDVELPEAAGGRPKPELPASSQRVVTLFADGTLRLGDRPVESLGGRTPLEAAHTPNLDALAATGTGTVGFDPLAIGCSRLNLRQVLHLL